MIDSPVALACPLLKPLSDMPSDGGRAHGSMPGHYGVPHTIARQPARRGAGLEATAEAGGMGVLIRRPPSWAPDGERRALFNVRIDRGPSRVAVGDAGAGHEP